MELKSPTSAVEAHPAVDTGAFEIDEVRAITVEVAANTRFARRQRPAREQRDVAAYLRAVKCAPADDLQVAVDFDVADLGETGDVPLGARVMSVRGVVPKRGDRAYAKPAMDIHRPSSS